MKRPHPEDIIGMVVVEIGLLICFFIWLSYFGNPVPYTTGHASADLHYESDRK